jgi:AraC family transcriptional regulator
VKALKISAKPDFREFPKQSYFYVRRIGDFSVVAQKAWMALHPKAAKSGLVAPRSKFLAVCHNDKGAYDAGLIPPKGAKMPVGLKRGILKGGRHAVFSYQGPYMGLGEAWAWVMSEWVMKNGALLRSAPCLEIYVSDATTTPEQKLITEIWIPVK